jgi:site-specific recombinase XerC
MNCPLDACQEPVLVALLAAYCVELQPGDLLMRTSVAEFRRRFKLLIAGLGLSELHSQPYSIRRGAATSLFRASNTLDAVALRGRWRNVRTARIYINTALQDMADIQVQLASKGRMQAAAAVLAKFLLD